MSVARVAASWFFACPMPPSGRPALRPVVCVGQGFAALGLNVHILRLLRAQCFRATSPLSAGAGRCRGDAGPDLALAAKWCFVRRPTYWSKKAARCSNGCFDGPHRSIRTAGRRSALGGEPTFAAWSTNVRDCTLADLRAPSAAGLIDVYCKAWVPCAATAHRALTA